jgi:hypothetical protein
MLTRRRNSMMPARYGAFLVGALVVLSSPATNAETRLTGQVDAIRMEARDASIEDVLSALGATYGLRFSTQTPLGAHITGTFTGPLLKVVAQVLGGYDYVSKSTNGAVEVAVVGVVGDHAVPSPATSPSFATLPPPPRVPSIRAESASAAPLALLDWEMPSNVAQADQKPATAPPPPRVPSIRAESAPAAPLALFDWEMPSNSAHPR